MALSESLKQQLNTLAERYPTKQALSLPSLYLLQDESGYVSEEGMSEVAQFLGLSPAYLRGVATFYTMFNKKKVGKYLIQLCTNVSCQLMGADTVLSTITKKLGIRVGETSSDGKFTVVEVECLACCGTAPVMQINDDYHEDLTVEKVEAILSGLD